MLLSILKVEVQIVPWFEFFHIEYIMKNILNFSVGLDTFLIFKIK